MKFKEITDTAAVLLGWDEPFGENADATLLARCANLTVGEIAAEYAPVDYTEMVETANGAVYFGSLKKDFLGIVGVTDECGNEVDYTLRTDYVKVPVGKILITYNYSPAKLAADDDVPVGDRRITARIIAYGAAAEYCLISGRFDEALIFNNKYTAGLKAALFRPRGRVAERSWL